MPSKSGQRFSVPSVAACPSCVGEAKGDGLPSGAAKARADRSALRCRGHTPTIRYSAWARSKQCAMFLHCLTGLGRLISVSLVDVCAYRAVLSRPGPRGTRCGDALVCPRPGPAVTSCTRSSRLTMKMSTIGLGSTDEEARRPTKFCITRGRVRALLVPARADGSWPRRWRRATVVLQLH